MIVMDHIFMGVHNIRSTPPVYWNKDETLECIVNLLFSRMSCMTQQNKVGEQQCWQHEAVSYCGNHLVSVVEHKKWMENDLFRGNRGEADEVKRHHNSSLC